MFRNSRNDDYTHYEYQGAFERGGFQNRTSADQEPSLMDMMKSFIQTQSAADEALVKQIKIMNEKFDQEQEIQQAALNMLEEKMDNMEDQTCISNYYGTAHMEREWEYEAYKDEEIEDREIESVDEEDWELKEIECLIMNARYEQEKEQELRLEQTISELKNPAENFDIYEEVCDGHQFNTTENVEIINSLVEKFESEKDERVKEAELSVSIKEEEEASVLEELLNEEDQELQDFLEVDIENANGVTSGDYGDITLEELEGIFDLNNDLISPEDETELDISTGIGTFIEKSPTEVELNPLSELLEIKIPFVKQFKIELKEVSTNFEHSQLQGISDILINVFILTCREGNMFLQDTKELMFLRETREWHDAWVKLNEALTVGETLRSFEKCLSNA